MSAQLLFGALFAFVLAAASFSLRFLTFGGAVSTFLLGVIIVGIGGWQWAIPIVTFFLLSSLLSFYGRTRKAQFDMLFEKSGTRDWGQVVANGGVAGLVAVLSALFPLYDFYPVYLGALASVTADTWGTEIGVLTKERTISVLTLKPVVPGTSGGVSWSGTMAGAIGAAVIALSGYLWYSEMRTAFIVVVAGVGGSLADSVIGGTLQAQYKCEVCGKATERSVHCGKPTTLAGGLSWIDNDAVNFMCALVGALVVSALMLVL